MSILAPVPGNIGFVCERYEADVPKQSQGLFLARNEDKSVCFKRGKGSVAGSFI